MCLLLPPLKKPTAVIPDRSSTWVATHKFEGETVPGRGFTWGIAFIDQALWSIGMANGAENRRVDGANSRE